MKLTRGLGAVIWLAAFTVPLWAPRAPLWAICPAAGALGLIGFTLLTWKPRR